MRAEANGCKYRRRRGRNRHGGRRSDGIIFYGPAELVASIGMAKRHRCFAFVALMPRVNGDKAHQWLCGESEALQQQRSE